MSQTDDKRLAALAAAAEVRDGMLVGLGTGSTAAFLIDALARRVADEGLRIETVATSLASERQATSGGLRVRPFAEVATVDLCIDGADEIDSACRAIKGAGGAMTREKIVAAAATRMVVIADGSKQVAQLGAAPVPVELLPFGQAYIARMLGALGGQPVLRQAGDAAYRTDQDNLIFDTQFGAIADPAALARRLSAIPGVVGHGLFVDEVDALYLARDGIVTVTERPVAR
jgi:ribose 5-phosphate isomerase A